MNSQIETGRNQTNAPNYSQVLVPPTHGSIFKESVLQTNDKYMFDTQMTTPGVCFSSERLPFFSRRLGLLESQSPGHHQAWLGSLFLSERRWFQPRSSASG